MPDSYKFSMKKNSIYIIIVFVFAAAAMWFLTRESKGTLDDKETGFAIQDTSLVTRIFIADKMSNQVTLYRNSDGWYVDNIHKANDKVVEGFLSTMYRIKVKSPVPKIARDNVVKRMSSIGIKVEVYESSYRVNLFDKYKFFPYEKLAKVYYVGDVTQDNLGTYMLLEDAEHPYIVHIPGFRGFLSPRYSPKPDDWRSHVLFNQTLSDIASVAIEFGEEPFESFRVDINTSTGDYKLTRIMDNSEIINYDTLKVLNFLTSFNDLRYETRLNNIMSAIKQDSIINSEPLYEITLIEESSDTTYIAGFYKKSLDESVREAAYFEFIPYDKDRFYGLANNGEDFVLLQYYIFDRVLFPLSYYTD